MKTVLKKCWTMLARGACWCCESLDHPRFHVGELWSRFTALKMSVWLQMKHSSVKWNERSWSNCSWVKPIIMPPVSASFASALQVHHCRAAAFNQEFSRKKGLLKQQRTGPQSGSREQTKENINSEIPVPSLRKKWKLLLLPGRIPLFWCFYSNSFHVPILQTCRALIMQHVEKADKWL